MLEISLFGNIKAKPLVETTKFTVNRDLNIETKPRTSEQEGSVIFCASTESSNSSPSLENNAMPYFFNWSSLSKYREFDKINTLPSPEISEFVELYNLGAKSLSQASESMPVHKNDNNEEGFYKIFHHLIVEVLHVSGETIIPSKGQWSLLRKYLETKFEKASHLLDDVNVSSNLAAEYGQQFLKFLIDNLSFNEVEAREFFEKVFNKVENNNALLFEGYDSEKNVLDLLRHAVKLGDVDFISYFSKYSEINLKKLNNSVPSFLRKLTENISNSKYPYEKEVWRSFFNHIYE